MGGKAAIILVIGFSFILAYISFNLNGMATRTIGNMATYHDATASHNLATIGANVGLAKFYQDTTWQHGSLPSQTMTAGGSFTVSMTDIGTYLQLRSVSTYPVTDPTATERTLYDTVEVYFDKRKLNSFSMYAWMTNVEGNVFWITGDTVWGRVHSNGNLHVAGKPTFMEKVTTSGRWDPRLGVGTNKAIIKKGQETGVAEIQFPNDLSELIAASTTGGRRDTTSIWVTLSPGTAANDDGKAYIRTTKTSTIIDSIDLGDATFNGVLLGTDTVHVQGTLDGKLSIASLGRLYIEDDILYEKNPRFTTSDDMLGLVAEGDILVSNNANNNNHCEIQASIFTRSGSFSAENYNTRPVSGELRVLGSIVQDTRGAVGTFNSGTTTINHGFSKRYRYDDRLADLSVRPPYYPGFYVKTYAISNWWENYRVTEFR